MMRSVPIIWPQPSARYDEEAKVGGLVVPSMENWVLLLAGLAD